LEVLMFWHLSEISACLAAALATAKWVWPDSDKARADRTSSGRQPDPTKFWGMHE
jgi:hypothetical protein